MGESCIFSDHSRPWTVFGLVIFLATLTPALLARKVHVREIQPPTRPSSAQPNLTVGPDGAVYLSWQESPAHVGEARLLFSVWRSGRWSDPRLISSGSNWFVNWADFPSLLVTEDLLMAHWLAKSGEGTFAYDVRLSSSSDGGSTWSQPITPHRDGLQAEHGFVSMIPWTQNRSGVVWLDGRLTASSDGHSGGGPMTLRFAAVNETGRLTDEAILDPRVCDCCQTSAARTARGAVVAYRDRSEDEVRDISAVVYEKGKWSRPIAVAVDGWQIQGCPVNGPAIAARGDDVGIAWYSMPESGPRVRFALSKDGGNSFSSPIRVDHGGPMGRVDLELLSDGSALISWLEMGEENIEIRLKNIAPDGTTSFERVVAPSTGTRSSGFPRIAVSEDNVYVAWVDDQEPSQVRVAVLSMSEADPQAGDFRIGPDQRLSWLTTRPSMITPMQ